jgi:predicted O-methyltransferase YrrM
MNEETWTSVDRYFCEAMAPSDGALEATLQRSAEAGLPAINVSPLQGKFLYLLAQTMGARRILEIGTLGGYSTIWLARALPRDGKLITLEADPKHAEVARANIAHAGLADIVELRQGRAIQTLPQLAGGEPFDLIFIDADKPSNPDYFAWAMKLSRPGSLIVIDNVVRKGGVIDASSDDASIHGTRRLVEIVGADARVTATAIQTVGSKGYDGFLIARVNAI